MTNKQETQAVELFSLEHTGTGFYFESGTEMSTIYEVGSHCRFDWGGVSMALKNGQAVNIRPATPEEELWAFKKLATIRKRREQWREAGTIA